MWGALTITITMLCSLFSHARMHAQEPSGLYEDLGGTAKRLPPIMFVPGLAGSLLQAEISRSSSVNSLCKLKGTQELWFDKSNFLPMFLDCWVEEMRLRLNLTAAELGIEDDLEPDGVHAHAKAYGSVKDAFFDYGAYHGGTGIWTRTTWELEKLGYNASRDIFALPYDWRRGPAHWKEHDWPRLKRFVEEKVSKAGKPAIFMVVSQGAPYFASFLHHATGVDLVWKRRHVAAFMSFSGVFGGTVGGLALGLWGKVQPLSHTVVGYDANIDYAGSANVKKLLRGWGGLSTLLPRAEEGEDLHTLIQLPPSFKGNITEKSLPSVLSQLSAEFGELYKLALRFPTNAHPGVKTFCFFGSDLPTPSSYVYLANPVNDTGDELSSSSILDEVQKLAAGKQPDLAKLVGAANQIVSKISEEVDEGEPASAPSSEPSQAAPYSKAWLQAVAELLERRQPDLLQTRLGDGLISHESLSICTKWKGVAGLPDADINIIQGASHGAELFLGRSLRIMRASVASVAGVPDSKDDSTYAPDGKHDMKKPLGEFESIVGPEVAAWSCQQWASIYGTVDGQDVVASGCPARLVLRSPACSKDCQGAFQKDQYFLHSRCPETCRDRSDSPRNGSNGGRDMHTTLGLAAVKDMKRPLAEFESLVGPGVAAWSCQQWAGLYGFVNGQSVIQSGCPAALILRSTACDAGCRSLYTSDPLFMRRRCPETCRGKTLLDDAEADGEKDLERPLKEFEVIVGPRTAAWSCRQWATRYDNVGGHDVIASGCPAELILKSASCDTVCRDAFVDDPFFLRRRCPETCRGRLWNSSTASTMPLPRNSRNMVVVDLGEFQHVVLPVTAALACVSFVALAALAIVVALKSRRVSRSSEEVRTPLHGGGEGEFSDFEGYANRSQLRVAFSSLWRLIGGTISSSSLASSSDSRQLELQAGRV
eukprot:TRINITY_DN63412_c0_g1_i1.p1 TRINITY_DN63412_c0_g1~~TRINITY_DN63412_c0_g1_i1.p1  ORF type:complete len:933 (-),score=148.38 TRINITY_DN63412_c0_g1_i1:133-2931(-)